MLIRYQMLTRRLLNDSTFARCNDFDLRDYINIARGQIAAIADCIPGYGVLEVGPETQEYPFTKIQFPGDNAAGIAGPIAIRLMLWQVGEGHKRLFSRAWPWFNQYELAQPVPARGEPRVFAQYGQGASGSIFINALNHHYRLTVDARVHPVDLVDDHTYEALPYLWTDAVPFYAAFYYAQGAGQPEVAGRMLAIFNAMMQTARGGSTPAVQPDTGVGGAATIDMNDPFMAGRLGTQRPGEPHSRQPRNQNPPTAA